MVLEHHKSCKASQGNLDTIPEANSDWDWPWWFRKLHQPPQIYVVRRQPISLLTITVIGFYRILSDYWWMAGWIEGLLDMFLILVILTDRQTWLVFPIGEVTLFPRSHWSWAFSLCGSAQIPKMLSFLLPPPILLSLQMLLPLWSSPAGRKCTFSLFAPPPLFKNIADAHILCKHSLWRLTLCQLPHLALGGHTVDKSCRHGLLFME